MFFGHRGVNINAGGGLSEQGAVRLNKELLLESGETKLFLSPCPML